MSALFELHKVAGEYQAVCILQEDQSRAICRLKLDFSDGSVKDFELMFIERSALVSVKEISPAHLPAFCPERHINHDGTFCLGFTDVENLEVTNEDSARNWWGRLLKYLKLQLRAAKLKKWPGMSWAHGSAAGFQLSLENYAKQLGQFFTDSLKSNKFIVKRQALSSSNRIALRLYCESRLLFVVWENLERVANTSQPCVCDLIKGKRKLRMKSCSNHAKISANFVLDKWKMQEAEREYWARFKNEKCCGTMNGCKLASN